MENIDVTDKQVVSESKSLLNDYSIKVFWIGPSGNDFEIDWLDGDTILLSNLTKETEQVKLKVQEESYDFR